MKLADQFNERFYKFNIYESILFYFENPLHYVDITVLNTKSEFIQANVENLE